MLLRKDKSRLSGNQKQSHKGGRVGFFRVVVPPCVLRHLTDKLIDSFRLYYFSLSVQVLTHKHPSETRGWGVGGEGIGEREEGHLSTGKIITDRKSVV